VGDVLGWMPAAATVFAVPQFLPQLARVWRTGDAAGVSWSWAALTSVSNGGWIAYFALSRFWAALVPSASVTVLAGVLAVLLGVRGGVPRRPVAAAAGWAALLALAGGIAGRAGLGIALTASFVLQVAPAVRAAYRTDRPTGVSRGTWLLILAELLCWGLYGLDKSDPRLIILGLTGVTAAGLILARARRGTAPGPSGPGLLVPEHRGALLRERARSFLGVLAAEHRHADRALDGERVVLRQALGLADRAQDGAHGDGPVGRDQVREF
jgi:uncharacterized protein with PQ loop repeat